MVRLVPCRNHPDVITIVLMQQHSVKPVPSPDLRPTLTVDEIVDHEWLPVSRQSLYAAIEAGEVPAIRVGRRILVPTSALRRLVGLDVDEAPSLDDEPDSAVAS
jgi:excisionase family DNA binding protein